MIDKFSKSKLRVRDYGEVFTPTTMVNKMIDQVKFTEPFDMLHKTFFEPAAGEGAFLVEILKRKMILAEEYSSSKDEYNENVLIALSSIYGIELLEDNLHMLIMNLGMTFSNIYTKSIKDNFEVKPSKNVIDSAKVIIRANIQQGDSLKKLNNKNEPIIFSEWRIVNPKSKIRKVKRIEYTLDSIINNDSPEEIKINNIEKEEQDLFSVMGYKFEKEPSLIDESEPIENGTYEFSPVKFTSVYKEQLRKIK